MGCSKDREGGSFMESVDRERSCCAPPCGRGASHILLPRIDSFETERGEWRTRRFPSILRDKEAQMLELSERASEEIKKQFLKGREGSQSIRIILTDGGWKGPYLAMAFDEARENDHVFTERGVTF